MSFSVPQGWSVLHNFQTTKQVKVGDQDPSDLPSLQFLFHFYEVYKRAQSPSETYALVPAAD